MAFSDGVPDALARALAARGYLNLTPVQRAVLGVTPPTRDMLASAETGSGKTVAFGLALAAQLFDPLGRARVSDAPLAAVITPTRELARQVRGELAWLYAATGVRIACCTGGADLHAERRRLASGCEVVVGSPGRLRDHVERGALVAGELECVVLDEADDMLDLGFRDDLEFLLRAAAPGRRTLMFSATVTPRIEALAKRFLTDAVRIVAEPERGGDIRFEAVAVAAADRERAVVNLLRYHEAQGAIVFCGRRATVGELASRLGDRGFRVVALSGAMPQRERDAAIAAMRDRRAQVCVATDLAARGLDLPAVDLVIHADLPASEAALTHRSGRTGRAGRAGRAILVVPHPLRRRAEALIARAGVALDWTPPPGPEAVRARDEARLLADVALGGAPGAEERVAAARLLAHHDPESLAVAYLRQAARARPAPEPLGAPGEPTRTARPPLKGAVWFTLEVGREGRAGLRSLLQLITGLGGVSRRDVGRVVMGEGDVRFEIAAPAAEAFAAAVVRPTEGGVRVRRAVEPAPPSSPGGSADGDGAPPRG